MPVRCVINLDDITTIPKVLIKQRIAALSAEKMERVAEAMRFALDWIESEHLAMLRLGSVVFGSLAF